MVEFSRPNKVVYGTNFYLSKLEDSKLMVVGERTAGLGSSVGTPLAGLDCKKCESTPLLAADASPKISKTEVEFQNVVYIRYRDHILFNHSTPMLMAPLVREAIGWLVYECKQYITLVLDRDARPPTLKGNNDPKATGLVILCSDIAEFKRLEDVLHFERSLNSQSASFENREYAHLAKESEKLSRKVQKRKKET